LNRPIAPIADQGYDNWMRIRDSLPLDIDPNEAADAEAMADYEAGRFISHEAMRAWILSWGTENELPRPKVGD
jgi:predicted transcriptional regulator